MAAVTWETCKTHGPDRPNVMGCPECLRELREENKRLRYHLTELGKFADRAGLVLATLEAENPDEEEQIQQIIDGISTWAAPAILGEVMGPNGPHEGPARASCAGPLDAVVGPQRQEG